MEEYNLGRRSLYLKNFQDSIDYFSKCSRECNPRWSHKSSAHFLLSVSYTYLERITEAELACHEALFIELDNALYRCFSGILQLERSRLFSPLRELRYAMKIDKENKIYPIIHDKLKELDETIEKTRKELITLFFENYNFLTSKKETFENVCLICRKETKLKQSTTTCECKCKVHTICFADWLREHHSCPKCEKEYE